MYIRLKNIIQYCCSGMPNVIFSYVKKNRKKNMFIYELFFEGFKNIESVLTNIDIVAFSQAGAILRNTIEQFSILKVLIDHPEIVRTYNKFAKLRVQKAKNHPDAETKIEELYNNRKTKNCRKVFYLDFGWLEELDVKELKIESVLKLANFEDLIPWRDLCNNYVHNDVSFTQYHKETLNYYIESFIYICAFLFDHMVCMFHNMTKFDFYINGIEYSIVYLDLYKRVREHREQRYKHT